ncbi:MAG: hypothetical protein EXS35_12555 [Pedosphaera sp.]|nr:hypothetical protein [Pedosphaera sp.]
MKIVIVSTLLFGLAVLTRADVPGIITYQGRVTAFTTNFTGAGQFKFALINGVGGQSLWSNNGTSVNGSEPTLRVPVSVAGGLFAVALGDTTLAGMTVAIPTATFTNGDVRLRIWFDDGTSGFAQLSPDQRLTSAGYAMRAANVVDGAITGPQLAPGFWNATNFPPDSVTSAQLADTLALGATNASGRLDIYRTTSNTPAISLVGSESRISTYGSDGLEQIRLYGTGWGELWLNNNLANNATAVKLTAQGATGGQLELRNTNGNNRAVLEGENAGGTLTLYQADGNTGAILYGNEGAGSGALSLRNTNGSARLRAYGGPTSGSFEMYDSDGTLTFNADAAEGPEGAQLNLYQANGARTVQLDAEAGANGGGYLGLYENDGTELVTAEAYGDGSVTVRQGDGSTGARLTANNGTGGGAVNLYRDTGTFAGQLTVDNSAGYLGLANSAGVNHFIGVGATASGGAALYLQDASGTSTIQLLGAQPSTGGSRIEMTQGDGTLTVILDGEVGTGGGGYLQLRNGAGVGTITLDSDFSGEGRITTQVLEITGGSDLAENFDIQSPHAEPGMIVRIDPAHPGELAVSDRAYDRTVAGVVSGAGGVKPGMLMGQRNSKADGKHPVALTGRVYCLVDASHGAVEPGDLITTSATPGHGMKVTDHTRAHGAIIGKAMTGLANGKGLVLLLVSLQ